MTIQVPESTTTPLDPALPEELDDEEVPVTPVLTGDAAQPIPGAATAWYWSGC